MGQITLTHLKNIKYSTSNGNFKLNGLPDTVMRTHSICLMNKKELDI